MKNYNYVIITSVKNEESVIDKTIQSVIKQTVPPKEWLIIDDKSTDKTREIIEHYSKKYKWIRCNRNTKVSINEKGSRIASIINSYLPTIEYKNYDYFSKLDGDLLLPEDFFKEIIDKFELDPELGIASGSLIYEGKKEKNIYKDLTRGASKIYRRECYIDIGGLQLTTGWDTIDNIMAQNKGWKTRVLDIWFEHLEEEGASQGFIKKYYNVGKYCGKIPYDPFYFVLKIIYRIFEWPIFLSSIITLFGYIQTRFITKERPFPKEVTKYYRNNQRNKLFKSIKKIFKL